MGRLMTAIPLALRQRRPALLLGAFLGLLVLGLAPQASAAGSGFFSPTGSMSVPRSGAAAAPLPDGRVLVAGGGQGSSVLSSAEIFDPATNTFSSAGIGSIRTGAAAAPLPDGRVLVVGGYAGGHDLSSAEVFDPATNTFSSAGIGSMSVPREGAVAAPLPDGRVLVAGGFYYGGAIYACYLSRAEAFDPATNTFSSAGIGSMTVPRSRAVAAPLPDGRVLVAGGVIYDSLFRGCFAEVTDPTADSSSAEIFNPATDTFSSEGICAMSVERDDAAAAPLPDGRVLVAGGYYFGGFDVGLQYLSSAEVFALGSAPPSATCKGPAAPPAPSATCRGNPATIVGTEANDVRKGTSGKDVIAGVGGNDKLSGLAGNDLICGGEGNDTLRGGAGNDQLYGQKGNDKLSGKAGNDTLKGGPGKDKLKGGAGKDKQVQ